MNITPAIYVSIPTVVNPQTDTLRRENNQREVIAQPAAASKSAAEKGVASEKDRARSPAQNNENIDFDNLKKQAELAANTISEQKGQQQGQQQGEQSQGQQQGEQSLLAEQNEDSHAEQEHQQELIDAKVILELKQRDKEVRAHELAHASTGGSTTGSPSYTYEAGPDGKKYAVSGEVSVDLSVVSGDPQATITKMQKVHAAALAPANPSQQDIKVAASATQKILAAQSEILAEQNQQISQKSKPEANETTKANSAFNQEKQYNTADDFDSLMNRTLAAQEAISASAAGNNYENSQQLASSSTHQEAQSVEVKQRSQRIESFYFKVSQGYERPDNFQFELTA